MEVCFGCRNQCNLCRTRSCGRVSQVHRRRRSRRIQNQCTCPDRYHVLLASTLRAGGRRKEGRPAFRVCARTAAEARGGSERERAARRAGILVPVSRTAVAGLGTLMSILFSQDFCTALTRAKARFATISNLVVVGAPAPRRVVEVACVQRPHRLVRRIQAQSDTAHGLAQGVGRQSRAAHALKLVRVGRLQRE